MTLKQCTRCKVKRNISEFNKRKISKDGLCPQCKICTRMVKKEWRPIGKIKARKDKKILGCTIPKITRAGHEVGRYDVKMLTAYNDKWYGWIWIQNNGNQFYPDYYQPLFKKESLTY